MSFFIASSSPTMKKGFLFSLLLHFTILILATFGLPQIDKSHPNTPLISVNIVNISEISNIAAQKKNNVEQKKAMPLTRQEQTLPLPKNKTIETPSHQKEVIQIHHNNQETVQSIAPKQDAAKAADNIKKSDVKTLNIKKPEVKKEQNTENKIINKTPAKQNKKNQNDSQKVLNSIKKTPIQNENNNILEDKFKEIEYLLESISDQPFNPEIPLSMSEIDSIRSQIKKSWNPIAFNGSGQAMRVTLMMQLEKNGNIVEIKPILEQNSNPSYKAFVESVIRAAKRASPLQNLNPNKFQTWREMEMAFSSAEMLY